MLENIKKEDKKASTTTTILNYAKDERPAWFPFVAKVFRSTIDSYVRSQRYAAENGTN